MSDDLSFLVPEDELPPKLVNAPPWAQQLSDRVHAWEVRQLRMAAQVSLMNEKLGAEPLSDGSGGKGLIGDLRKLSQTVAQLLDLKKMGIGAVGGISLFGTLIILGFMHWVQGIRIPGK